MQKNEIICLSPTPPTLPVEAMMTIGELYRDIAECLTGKPVPRIGHARQEILDALAPYGIVQ